MLEGTSGIVSFAKACTFFIESNIDMYRNPVEKEFSISCKVRVYTVPNIEKKRVGFNTIRIFY